MTIMEGSVTVGKPGAGEGAESYILKGRLGMGS